MLSGWRGGEQFTASQTRSHFPICPKRPAASEHAARRLAGSDGVNLRCSDQTDGMGDGFRQFLTRSVAQMGRTPYWPGAEGSTPKQ
jgi:hypothetical protein